LDLALLFLRVTLAILILGHGTQKLFGWFNGRGLQGTYKLMQSLRLRPAWLWMLLAIGSEVGGALLFAFGFIHPLGALSIIATMLMGAITFSWPRNHYWGDKGGIEYNFLFMIPAIAEGIAGPGKYSLDAALSISLPEPVTFLAGLVLVVLTIGLCLVTRRPKVAASTENSAISSAAAK
jgi:putative oxidoreductase